MSFARNGTVHGVSDGAKPLKVVIPSLKGSSMAQSNPILDDKNMLTVTLVPNVNLGASEQSSITISGLHRAIAPSTVSLLPTLADASSNTLFAAGGVQGTANFGSDSILLTVAAGQLLIAHQQYEFAFEVLNPAVAQAAPELTVEATGTAWFVPERLPGPNLEIIGVLNGTNPMLLIRPEFTLRTIAQSHPFSSYLNTYTCALTVNVNLAKSHRSYLDHLYPGRSRIALRGFTDATAAGSSVGLASTASGNQAHLVRASLLLTAAFDLILS